MVLSDRYDAYWLPLRDVDDEQSRLELARAWVDRPPRSNTLLVLNAKSMTTHSALRPVSHMAVTSPNTRSQNRPMVSQRLRVLTYRPSPQTLKLAEMYALDGELCVVGSHSNGLDPIGYWVDRTEATNLAPDQHDTHEALTLDPEVATALDSILQWDGHNDFRSSGDERKITKQDLRSVANQFPRLTEKQVEQYALRTGLTSAKGAAKLAEFFRQASNG